jgi:hypothetical protein
MRPAAFVVFAAIVLAVVAGQNALLRPTEANNSSPAITECAREGAAVQGVCSPVSLDSNPGSIVSYNIFVGGCAGGDLHVVRYLAEGEGSSSPAVAKWCS